MPKWHIFDDCLLNISLLGLPSNQRALLDILNDPYSRFTLDFFFSEHLDHTGIEILRFYLPLGSIYARLIYFAGNGSHIVCTFYVPMYHHFPAVDNST